MIPELSHPAFQGHQRRAEVLDLLVAERALFHSAQRLPLHHLAQQFHDREDQADQAALHRLGIGVDSMPPRGSSSPDRAFQFPVGRHRPGSPASTEGPARALTDVTSARSETVTRSTSATDNVTSPATTTPPARTLSSRSTRAMRSAGKARPRTGRRSASAEIATSARCCTLNADPLPDLALRTNTAARARSVRAG